MSFLDKIDDLTVRKRIESEALRLSQSVTLSQICQSLDSVPQTYRLAYLEVMLEHHVSGILQADSDERKRLCYDALLQKIPSIQSELDLVYPILVERELCFPRYIDAACRFALRRQLLGGAQAKVAIAFDAVSKKEVVVKFEEVRYENRIHTLKRESDRLEDCDHPNIVRCVESFTKTAQFGYFVMEYLPNNLRDKISVSHERAARIGSEICDALIWLETHKLDHGDIKPENIAVTAQMRPKLLDLGLSKDLDNGMEPNKPKDKGTGTKFYLTPEALSGSTQFLSAASEDRFALAICLIELICPRDTRENMISQMVHDSDWVVSRFERLKALLAAHESPLARVLLAEISLNPHLRHAQTEDFKDALDDAYASIRRKESLFGGLEPFIIGRFRTVTLVFACVILALSLSIVFLSTTRVPLGESRKSDTLDKIAGASVSSMSKEIAAGILDRVQRNRDGALQGQDAAIAFLIAEGWEFANCNLSGVSLKGANLSNGNFRSADFRLCSVENGDHAKAIFSETRMEFVNLSKSIFRDCDFRLAYAPFSIGLDAKFPGVDFTRVNLTFSDLRGADFSNADLTSAALSFCDLRGAQFTGATLTNTSFSCSILDGADFSDAQFQNTNLISVSVSGATKITDDQLRNVVHRPMERPTVIVMEYWDSPKFSSGHEYEQVDTEDYPTTDEPRMKKHLFTPLPYLDDDKGACRYDPSRLDIYLPKTVLDNSRARRAVMERVRSHIKTISDHINVETFLLNPHPIE